MKPLIETLKGKPAEVPPVWLMRQAGRYLPEYRKLRARAGGFLDFCLDPGLACEATLQPIRRFGLDGAIIFSDILVIPHALGQKVGFVEGTGPVLEALATPRDLSRLSGDDLAERLRPVYEALALVRAELPHATALIGFAGAPWTVASYMVEGRGSRDFLRVKSWAYGEEESFARLIALLTDAVSRHLIAQADAGAEALQIFDSWAGVLPEPAFRRWSIAPIAEIARRVKAAHPDVPIIGFPNRAGALYADFAREAGLEAVSLDATVPLAWAAREVQPRACVQGNLDPALLVTGGRPMEDAARAIVAGFRGGAHVFNLGHGVVPETPPDNVARLVAVLREESWRGDGR